MRNLVLALVVVGIAAAPGFGYIDVRLQPFTQLVAPGATTNVDLQVFVNSQATYPTKPAVGIGIVAGNVNAGNTLAAVTGLSWIAQMQNTTSPAQGGALDGTGGWDGFAATQAVPNDTALGNMTWSTVLTLTVQAGMAPGVYTLAFENVGVLNPLTGQNRVTSSLSLGGIPATFDTLVNSITGCEVVIIPEPVSLALLAIGGLVVARRRR